LHLGEYQSDNEEAQDRIDHFETRARKTNTRYALSKKIKQDKW